MKTTVAYSKSTRESYIDVRGKVDGEANTISTGDGGGNQSTQNFVAELSPVIVGNTDVNRGDDNWNGPRDGYQIYDSEAIAPTVRAKQANNLKTIENLRIRKLTPVECERLQGYPDNLTKFGRREDGTIYEMSNTQRYKQCGNGVSSPVASTILQAMIPEGEVRVQSLFSGILGTELDLPERFKLTGTCEFDKYASDVIRYHYPDVPNYKDVTKFIDRTDVLPFDLLTFGFPCQAFSIAGQRKGFDDEKGRGTLIFNVFDILEKHKPKYILAENVKGLLNHNGGETFMEILKGLSQLGYDIDFELVNSKNFGLAQNRERVFIFGKLR